MPTLTQMAEAERLRANQANEQRYQQAISAMQTARQRMTSLFDTARAQLATQGKQAGIDIDVGAGRLQAQTTQNLMTAGLGNTTVRGAMARGVETDRTAAQARLAEGRQAQQAGLLTQQAGAEMGGAQALTNLMGQRQDVGPPMGQYASLARAAAGGGGGYTPADWSSLRGGGEDEGGAGYRAQEVQRRATQEQEWQSFLTKQKATRAAGKTFPRATGDITITGGGVTRPGAAGPAPGIRLSRYGTPSAAGGWERRGGNLVRRG